MSLELLRSEMGADGLWHARYPTATLTLCGKPVGSIRMGRPGLPDCGLCAKTARLWDRVDGSMPDAWRLPV